MGYDINELIEQATEQCDWHEAANMFPLFAGDDFDALVDDIKTNGQMEPILTIDGKVVDGRNRQLACIAAGVDPQMREMPSDMDRTQIAQWVWSLNYNRRHLTPSQRGMATAEMRKYLDNKTVKQAAQVTGASVRSAERAERVKKNGHAKLVKAVQSGAVTLTDAERILSLSQNEQEKRVDMVQAGQIASVVYANIEPDLSDNETQWMQSMQQPYDDAVKKIDDALKIVSQLQNDTRHSVHLPTTRIRVELTAAKSALTANYPYVYCGGNSADESDITKGAGFLTKFVWEGLTEEQRHNIRSTLQDERTTTDAVG